MISAWLCYLKRQDLQMFGLRINTLKQFSHTWSLWVAEAIHKLQVGENFNEIT